MIRGIGLRGAIAVNVITMIGIWLAGAVFVPLNTRATASETAKIVEVTGPAATVSEDGMKASAGGRVYSPGTALVLW